MITMKMREMRNDKDKDFIYRLERGLRDVPSMWHPYRYHKRDTWAKEKSHVKVNTFLFSD